MYLYIDERDGEQRDSCKIGFFRGVVNETEHTSILIFTSWKEYFYASHTNGTWCFT